MLTRVRTRLIKYVIVGTVVSVLVTTGGGWPDWRDGDDEDDRTVVVTVTWSKAGDQPGVIEVRGHLAGPYKHEAYTPSPFVESGLTMVGDVVDVHASALDGPFISFDCSIVVKKGAALIGGETQKTIWPGLRAYCRRTIS
jgi:hypothetical protein